MHLLVPTYSFSFLRTAGLEDQRSSPDLSWTVLQQSPGHIPTEHVWGALKTEDVLSLFERRRADIN